MVDARRKDLNWTLNFDEDGLPTTENAMLAVLMDIRDELKALNRWLACPNVFEGFRAMQRLRTIDKRLAKQWGPLKRPGKGNRP